jgi:hypothetical protein
MGEIPDDRAPVVGDDHPGPSDRGGRGMEDVTDFCGTGVPRGPFSDDDDGGPWGGEAWYPGGTDLGHHGRARSAARSHAGDDVDAADSGGGRWDDGDWDDAA